MQASRARFLQWTFTQHTNVRRVSTSSPSSPAVVPKKMQGPGEDFRPQWVYVGSRLVSFVVIPMVGLYSVFFYDFGQQNHVFTPIRRWTSHALGSFLTLSSEEKRLLQQEQERQQTGENAKP